MAAPTRQRKSQPPMLPRFQTVRTDCGLHGWFEGHLFSFNYTTVTVLVFEDAAPAVHRVHQGMCIRLHPRALMRMWRCRSPRRHVSRSGAMFCSVAYPLGYLKDAVCAVRRLHPLCLEWTSPGAL